MSSNEQNNNNDKKDESKDTKPCAQCGSIEPQLVELAEVVKNMKNILEHKQCFLEMNQNLHQNGLDNLVIDGLNDETTSSSDDGYNSNTLDSDSDA